MYSVKWSNLSVCEGGDGGDAPSAGDQAAEQAAKNEAAADGDAKPSTTTTGDLIKALSVCRSAAISDGQLRTSVLTDFKDRS